MTSAAKQNQIDKFPFWATLVIVLVVGAYAAVYVSGVLVIRASQRLARDLVDPQNIAMVASAIGEMPEKLPEGFTYRVGLSVNDEALKKWFGLPSSPDKIKDLAKMSLNFLAIEHAPDGQQILIICSPPEDPPKDAKEVLQAAYDSGINTGTTMARFQTVAQRGETQIAGLPMTYIIGETEDTNHKKRQGMVGCIVLKDKHRNMLVSGIQPEGQNYNLNETLELLRCIQGL
jgi:hypothetical protein